MFGLFKKTTTAESFNEEFADFAKEIITVSALLAERYLETRKDKFDSNNEDVFNTTNEFIYLFFHCLSRECYVLKGKKAQIEIYEPIAKLAYNILTIGSTDADREEYAEIFTENHLKAEKLYANCHAIKNDEGSLIGTVVIEASKRIAITDEKEDILLASDMVFLGLKVLKINERIKNL